MKPRAQRFEMDAVAAFALAVAVIGAYLIGCDRHTEELAGALTGGDVKRGKLSIRRHGCGTCHSIPGVPRAEASVGPPLDGIARRAYLAGQLTNTPENMLRWVQHPQEVRPGSAMPEMDISEPDARDIAAYLYTLR